MQKDLIFISYSHQDKKWLKELLVHLEYLEKDYDLNLWHDNKIAKGALWNDEIKNAIRNAKIAILLVSADFLRSDFIRNNELPDLLKSAEEDGSLIYTIVVADCMFHDLEQLSKYQSFNSTKNSLDKLKKSERNTIYVELTSTIKNCISRQQQKPKESVVKNSVPYSVELSFYITYITEALYNCEDREQGCSISQIIKLSKLTSRKLIVKSLEVLSLEGVVTKVKDDQGTKWKINPLGEQLIEKLKKLA